MAALNSSLNGANDEHGRKLVDFPSGLQYHYERGAALYRVWEPMPKRPYDEEARELPHTEEEFMLFCGWMCARDKYLMKCRAVEDALHDPDPKDPRPPMALAA